MEIGERVNFLKRGRRGDILYSANLDEIFVGTITNKRRGDVDTSYHGSSSYDTIYTILSDDGEVYGISCYEMRMDSIEEFNEYLERKRNELLKRAQEIDDFIKKNKE